jgi:hypothetical protein
VCFSLCANELLDPGESDVDCGGECEPCNNGDSCFVNENCASNSCVGATRESHDDAEAGVCRAPTCSDDALNSDEEGIDCGGSCGGGPCPLECGDGSVWYNASDFADADGGVTDEHFIIPPGGLDLYRSGDPECAARSVGYTERVIRFTAPLTGVWVFSTVGRHTNFDSIIYAYFETCATGAVEMGCNDDAEPGDSASTLELRLTEGDVLFLVVDGAPVLMDREFILNIHRED